MNKFVTEQESVEWFKETEKRIKHLEDGVKEFKLKYKKQGGKKNDEYR